MGKGAGEVAGRLRSSAVEELCTNRRDRLRDRLEVAREPTAKQSGGRRRTGDGRCQDDQQAGRTELADEAQAVMERRQHRHDQDDLCADRGAEIPDEHWRFQPIEGEGEVVEHEADQIERAAADRDADRGEQQADQGAGDGDQRLLDELGDRARGFEHDEKEEREQGPMDVESSAQRRIETDDGDERVSDGGSEDAALGQHDRRLREIARLKHWNV